MGIKVTVNCPKCGINETEWLDSIPYCPKCGKPMGRDNIVGNDPDAEEE